MAAQKQGDQLERTFSSYVRIQDVVLKTYLGRWTIGRSGERGSGISVLPARYDDDDDMYIHIYLYYSIISNLPIINISEVFSLVSIFIFSDLYPFSPITYKYIYIYIYIPLCVCVCVCGPSEFLRPQKFTGLNSEFFSPRLLTVGRLKFPVLITF